MTSAAPAASTHERSVRELLLDPTFGRYFAGNLTSNCGNWIQNVAAATAVFSLTRSATRTGVVSGALWLGSLVLQPYAGAVSDRIQALQPNGFQLGTGTEVNANTVSYHYLAVRSSAP